MNANIPVATTFMLNLLLTTAMALSPLHVTANEKTWNLELKEQGISVFTRAVEDSPYPEVKATTIIDAPLMRVGELLGDGNSCVEWRSMCESSRVIEKTSEHEQYIHLVLDLPWPVKDRDMVMRSTTNIDTASRSVMVDLQSASSRQPVGDYIRAESSGQFFLRAIGEEQVEFTYTMHTDLGGDLPAGPVNARLVSSTFEDLNRLRKLAES